MKEFIKKNFPGYLIMPVLILIVSNLGVYYGAKVFNELLGRPYLDMTGTLEIATPVIPMFSLFYVAAYPFWYISYYLLCRKSKELCYNIVLTDVLAKIFCGLIFILIPTTNVRPEIANTGIPEFIMNFVYSHDTPHNLFPSIHCLESWLCFAYINDLKDCKWPIKAFSFIMALGICLSTVFIRQHVWIDVFAGVIIAEGFRVLVPYLTSALAKSPIKQNLQRS